MRKRSESRKGLAAVEFAMMLPLMAMLLFTLVEGSNAMHAYSSLVEASREGARMALTDGGLAEVQAMVRAVTNELDPEHLSTSVTTDAGSNTVTVEVSYGYQPFNTNALEMLMGQEHLTLVAQTTMPLP